MKEPLPQARPLIEQVYLERLDAEREFDVRTNWVGAAEGGVAVAAAILVAVKLFGAVNALVTIAALFVAMIIILDNRRN